MHSPVAACRCGPDTFFTVAVGSVETMLAEHGDAVRASPHILLPALLHLASLHNERTQLVAEAEALRVAQVCSHVMGPQRAHARAHAVR